MKKTGIVRRIDELGRIVIPREMRRTLRLHEGSQVEISINKEQEIVLSKYSHINEISDYAQSFCDIGYELLEMLVLICDMDKFVACSNTNKKEYILNDISEELEKIINLRRSYISNVCENGVCVKLVNNDSQTYTSQIVVPIISNSDLLGAIVVVNLSNKRIGKEELKVAQTISKFLSKELE